MDKTKDNSKFNQMAGEAATALALWNNIGHLVKKEDFPKDTKCLMCSNPMTQAEHLVNKAHGGNHTQYNVIPVCNTHKKPGGKGSNSKTWEVLYGPELTDIIKQHVGHDHKARLNPYHDENKKLIKSLRNHVKDSVLTWRKHNGMI